MESKAKRSEANKLNKFNEDEFQKQAFSVKIKARTKKIYAIKRLMFTLKPAPPAPMTKASYS